jgi:[acyl-carrier-protein] S-malonyltransferase
MARDAFDEFGSARAVFSLADQSLGSELSRICFEGPEEDLTSTDNAQPAILAASLSYLAAAMESAALAQRPAFLAGHSLGEYTALVAAGSLSSRDALLLVRERGRLMARAGKTNPGTLAAILGLDEEAAEAICIESGAEPANYNLATQTVVGGTAEAVERAMQMAKARGGKALPVKVSGAFHTSLMATAAAEFASVTDQVSITNPEIPVVSNVTAKPMTEAEEIRRDLREQIMRPVRWRQTVEFLANAGVTRFVEVGPGRVLANMLKRGAPDAEVSSIDSIEALRTMSRV